MTGTHSCRGRIAALAGAFIWLVQPTAVPALRAASFLEFVHITDTHVADFTGVRANLRDARKQNQTSADALSRFFDAIGRDNPPAFIVHTGDAIEAYCFDGAAGASVYGQIPLFLRISSRSRIPLYLALGNHDIECYRQPEDAAAPIGDQSVSREARREWRRSVRSLRKGSYYSLRKRVGRTTYRLLFLDNAESPKTIDPAFRAAQFRWLSREIGGHSRDAIVLLMHIPFRDDWFFRGMAAALGQSADIALVVAGHRHSNGIEVVPVGRHRATQVRTASLAGGDLNWRRFRLAEDRIEIRETGYSARVLKTIYLRRSGSGQ